MISKVIVVFIIDYFFKPAYLRHIEMCPRCNRLDKNYTYRYRYIYLTYTLLK